MRFALVLIVCPIASCGDGALSGPAAPAAPAAGAAVRIVEPGAGQCVPAGEEFGVLVVQELRGGPAQGRGRLELSETGERWHGLGAEFPWTREGRELRISARLERPGAFLLRLGVREEARAAPFLFSKPVLVYAVAATRSPWTSPSPG